MDIKIGRSAHQCVACEKAFEHEEGMYSLVRIEEKILVREDYCHSCWSRERSKQAYSCWTPKYYDPKVAEQEPAEVFSPLRQLFYEAVESEERLERAKAFLAAQLLRRQKVFRQIKESDEGEGEEKIILYSDRIGNRLIEVRDPNFAFSELEEARGLLMARLQELEQPQEEAEDEKKEENGDDGASKDKK